MAECAVGGASAAAATPTGADRPSGSAGNRLGRLTCLTLFTPVRPGWLWLLRLSLWAAKWVPLAQRHILQFNFIRFVRWTVVDGLPYNGQPPGRLKYPYLMFESNFDGPWQHYIDAFAYCIPADIRLIWGRGPDFPGPPPSEPLKRWIARNSMEGGTYYCAYEQASVRMVLGALAVRRELRRLVADAGGLSPAQFQSRYQQLLTELQADL